jgi:replicative DNA helicase
LLQEVVGRLEQYSEGVAPGLKTGFLGVDKVLNPLEGGSLTVVAGRPAMGKTAFASQILMQKSLEGLSVALFSLEMSASQIMERNLSNLGRVDLNSIRDGSMSDKGWVSIATATYQLSKAKYYVEERARTIAQVREKCFEIRRDVGLDLICIDYLQLMSATSAENRTTEISAISRGLKMIAMDMKIPVIALSQLNRGLEQRQDKRPMMSDLRESGAIEQDADNILFIYRDEVYNPQSLDRGRAEIIVSKQRNGPTGMHKMSFLGPYTRFEE